MRLTRKKFEAFIKSKNYDQLVKILLDITKDNKELEKEIYFKFEGIQEFSQKDFKKIYDELMKVNNKARRSLTKFSNRNDLSQCLTSLIGIFSKKIKPLAKAGYYEYVLNLISVIFAIIESYLNENKTKRLLKFKEDLTKCLYDMLNKLDFNDLVRSYFFIEDLIAFYDIENLKNVFYNVFLEPSKLKDFEKTSQQWLKDNYIGDLTKNVDDTTYKNTALFNTSLKDKLGIDNSDMKDSFINCFGVRNYFVEKLFKDKNYQELIDYSKRIKKLKELEPADLKILNKRLIETYRILEDKEHLAEEIEYNISSYDQENLELLAEFLSFYDRSEQKEQAEWFMGSKTFNHDYDLFWLNKLVDNLLNKKYRNIFKVQFDQFYKILYFLMPQEVVDYTIWLFENTIDTQNTIEEYDYLTMLLEKAKDIDEKRITDFSKEVSKKYPTRRNLQRFLSSRNLI